MRKLGRPFTSQAASHYTSPKIVRKEGVRLGWHDRVSEYLDAPARELRDGRLINKIRGCG